MLGILASTLLAFAPATELSAPAPAPASDPVRVGVALDAGAPDGLGASIVLRPRHWARLELSGLTNGFSAGMRGGVSWIPLDHLFSPSLTLEFGGFWPGNANALAAKLLGDPSFHSGYLDRISYTFANAQLGLEVGRGDFQLSLHAGYSRVWMTSESFAEGLQEASGGSTITASPAYAQLIAPSAKVGFTLFFG